MQKQFLQTFKIIILGLVLGIGVNYISAAWTPAPASPPNSNVDAPLNVGPDDQIKAGIVASDGTCTAPKCGGLTVGILSVVGKALFQNPIQINAGSPGPGKVLTSTDARGNAEWQPAQLGSVVGFTRDGSGSLNSSAFTVVPNKPYMILVSVNYSVDRHGGNITVTTPGGSYAVAVDDSCTENCGVVASTATFSFYVPGTSSATGSVSAKKDSAYVTLLPGGSKVMIIQ